MASNLETIDKSKKIDTKILDEDKRQSMLADIEIKKSKVLELRKFILNNINKIEFQKMFFKKCAIDCIFFIETCLTLVEPRAKKNKVAPFILFERQVELVNAVVKRYKTPNLVSELIVQKSRGVGYSWVMCAICVWASIFHKNSVIVLLSRDQKCLEEVGASTSSLFGKLRYIISCVPKFLIPNFSFDKSKGGAKNKYLFFKDSNSVIEGYTGKNAGRGSRATMIIVDECAFIENMNAVSGAISDTSFVKIYGSTLHEKFDAFDNKLNNANSDDIICMEWWCNPLKDLNWYLHTKRQESVANFDREFNFKYTSEGINYLIDTDKLDYATVDINSLETSEDKLSLNEEHVVAGYDPALTGNNNALYIRHGYKEIFTKTWKGADTIENTKYVLEQCSKYDVSYLFYDSNGIGEGVRVALNDLEDNKYYKHYFNQFVCVDCNFGKKPIDIKKYDSKDATECFLNLKAQLFWEVRDRVHNFYYRAKHDTSIKLIDCVNIRDIKLKKELISLTFEVNGSNKYLITPKAKMKAKGIPSPDLADACAFTFMYNIQYKDSEMDADKFLEYQDIAANPDSHNIYL